MSSFGRKIGESFPVCLSVCLVGLCFFALAALYLLHGMALRGIESEFRQGVRIVWKELVSPSHSRFVCLEGVGLHFWEMV